MLFVLNIIHLPFSNIIISSSVCLAFLSSHCLYVFVLLKWVKDLYRRLIERLIKYMTKDEIDWLLTASFCCAKQR